MPAEDRHLLREVVGADDVSVCFNVVGVELVRLENLLDGVSRLCWVEHDARTELSMGYRHCAHDERSRAITALALMVSSVMIIALRVPLEAACQLRSSFLLSSVHFGLSVGGTFRYSAEQSLANCWLSWSYSFWSASTLA